VISGGRRRKTLQDPGLLGVQMRAYGLSSDRRVGHV
jgi:hypothetical protein